MEPLSALSIASAVIQIADFSSKVIARTREVYSSASGTIEETTLLEDAMTNLEDLMIGLESSISRKSAGRGAFHQKTADQQLLHLAKESHAVAADLREMLNKVKLKKDGRQRGALNQGLRSVLEQKNISALKEKLDEIRKQIDTALLISLRYVE